MAQVKPAHRAVPGVIRVGIGGWTFAPWRETFYPAGLPQAKALAHASRQVTTIEVNGTFYRTQSPATFRRWATDVPDDFMFSLKASRYSTNRSDLGEAASAVERFVTSGISELGPKLGPILWQLAPTKRFDEAEIAGFLGRLPPTQDGLALRHVIEPRHASFGCEAFVRIARDHNVAICLAISDSYPLIADPTADFSYIRLQTSTADHADGFDKATLDVMAAYARTFAAGHVPVDLPTLLPPRPAPQRDCFLYVIGGAKERNPAAARALLERLG